MPAGLYYKIGGLVHRLGDVLTTPPVIPDPQMRVRVGAVKFGTAAGTPPTAWANPRLGLVPGSYDPAITTIGGYPVAGIFREPAAPARTQHQGQFNATANGQVIENLEIFGRVWLGSFTGVILRNLIVWGPPNTSANWGTLLSPIDGTGSNLRGAIIEDSWIRGTGNFWVCAMRGGGYTMRRCEITGHQDGISLTSSVGNVTVEASWLHNALYAEFSQAQVDSGEHPAGGSNYTHCDGVQFHVGKHYVFRGNNIGGVREPWDHHLGHEADINAADDWYNASFMIKQEVSTAEQYFLDDILIENNILWGGSSTVNITTPAGTAAGPKNYLSPKPAEGGRPERVGCIIRNNQFPYSTWDDKLKTRIAADGGVMDSNGQAYILRDLNVGVFSNNTHPDGKPVPIRNGGNYVSATYP